MELDLRTMKKGFMNLTINDALKLTLIQPTVGFVMELEDLQKNPNPSVSELVELTAKALSRNRQGKKITSKQVGELFEIGEMMQFLGHYIQFIGEAEKNF